MNIEETQKANDLILALAHGINMQQEIIDGLKLSLEEYQNYLTEHIRELQNELHSAANN